MSKEIDGVEVIGKNILIKFPELSDKSEGGLYIPESVQNQDDNIWGELVKVGDEVTKVKVGDKIFLRGLRVGEVLFDKELYCLANVDNVSMVKRK